MKRLILILLTVALALTSCNRNTIYSHYQHTPLDGWEKNDTLVFDVVPVRSDGTYSEVVGLRMSSTYPFMGLTLIVEQEVWPSGLTHSDTLWCRLIDRDGNIQGEGISTFQYNFQLRNLRLNTQDSLHITIRHNMKREILPGVADVGVTLRRVAD